MVNSFSLSATAAIVIVLVAVPLAYFLVWRRSRLLRVLNLAAEMPYALPGVVLAIAAILVFLKPLPVLGLTLYNTVWIILFGYLARFLVLGLRPVIGGYYQLDRTLEEAAQIAGARLLRRLATIILPLVAPMATAGALLVFLTAFNELTVSALLWSSGAETLGVVVFSFQQGGDSTYAAALAMLTVAVTIALMLSTLLTGKPARGVLPCSPEMLIRCPMPVRLNSNHCADGIARSSPIASAAITPAYGRFSSARRMRSRIASRACATWSSARPANASSRRLASSLRT